MATTAITLTEVKAQLDKWRSHKIRKNDPVPNEIKANIAHLAKKYRHIELRKKLKISYEQITAFTREPDKHSEVSAPPPTLPSTGEFEKVMLHLKQPLLITIDNSKGNRLSLQLSSISEAEIIINNFVHGGNKC